MLILINASIDSCSEFLFTDESIRRHVIIFGADMSWSVHAGIKNKDILIFGPDKDQMIRY